MSRRSGSYKVRRGRIMPGVSGKHADLRQKLDPSPQSEAEEKKRVTDASDRGLDPRRGQHSDAQVLPPDHEADKAHHRPAEREQTWRQTRGVQRAGRRYGLRHRTAPSGEGRLV